MTTERANNLVAFKKFIDDQISNGRAELKLDEALARWEYENQTPEDRQEALEAIQEGLQNRDAGKSRSGHQFLAPASKLVPRVGRAQTFFPSFNASNGGIRSRDGAFRTGQFAQVAEHFIGVPRCREGKCFVISS
jgi:hypothetical protein